MLVKKDDVSDILNKMAEEVDDSKSGVDNLF